MIFKIVEGPKGGKHLLLCCDRCQKSFKRRWRKQCSEKALHFCSKLCQHRSLALGGKMAKNREETCISRYGVPNVLSSDAVREKISETMVSRYGADNPSKSPALRKKAEANWAKLYGIGGPLHSDMISRMHLTMKNNGTFGNHISKIEKEFYADLVQLFGFDDVEIQIPVSEWRIDFYIESRNLYIEFEGVYWHGLDRPLDEIVSSDSERDQRIYTKYLSDRRRDKFMSDYGHSLIKVTDKWYKSQNGRGEGKRLVAVYEMIIEGR